MAWRERLGPAGRRSRWPAVDVVAVGAVDDVHLVGVGPGGTLVAVLRPASTWHASGRLAGRGRADGDVAGRSGPSVAGGERSGERRGRGRGALAEGGQPTDGQRRAADGRAGRHRALPTAVGDGGRRGLARGRRRRRRRRSATRPTRPWAAPGDARRRRRHGSRRCVERGVRLRASTVTGSRLAEDAVVRRRRDRRRAPPRPSLPRSASHAR